VEAESVNNGKENQPIGGKGTNREEKGEQQEYALPPFMVMFFPCAIVSQ
jgi:hypothetical protein